MDHAQRYIQAENLSVRYGKTTAVKECTVSCRAGELTLLLGGNGAGKTSLLRALAGLLRPSKGTISISDSETPGMKAYFGEHAYVYQVLSVREMLSFYKKLSNTKNLDVDAQLSYWRLESIRDKRVQELSRGQLLRLGLACCTLRSPLFQFFDEPTSVLDDAATELFCQYAIERKEAVTLVASHDVERLLPSVSRVLLLKEGRLLADSHDDAWSLDDVVSRYREMNR